MNKTELTDAIAAKSGLTKTDSKKALDAFLEVVKETLTSGEAINITGFMSLSVKERGERQGINPKTKETITIAARKAVAFKAGAELDDAVRNS